MNTKYIIHNFLNHEAKNESEFRKTLIRNISDSDLKLGGFNSKKYLVQKINGFVNFNKGEVMFNKNQAKNIQEIVKKTLDQAIEALANEKTVHVYLIPTSSEFLKEKMDGIQGWCTPYNGIHLYIHPNCNLEIALVETLVHEYNHSVFFKYHKWNTVQDGLVAEGLAEHFRMELVGGKRAKWTKAFSEKASKIWFQKIKPILNSDEADDYYKVFVNFEETPYPLWTGYTIGYYLIKNFRVKNNLSWNELISLDVEQILSKY